MPKTGALVNARTRFGKEKPRNQLVRGRMLRHAGQSPGANRSSVKSSGAVTNPRWSQK